MIVEFLLGVAENVSTWFLGLIPPLPHDSINDAQTGLGQLGGLVGSMSVWVNWIALAAQVSLVLSTYFAFLAIKILRALMAHVPFIGGNG